MLTDTFEGNLPVYTRLIFLTTGSKSTTNHGLKRSAVDLVCGTADECRDKVEECCREQTIAAKHDVVVIGSGLAGSATVAALSGMLSDRGLGETVALVDASKDLVQGGGSTAPGVAWSEKARGGSTAPGVAWSEKARGLSNECLVGVRLQISRAVDCRTVRWRRSNGP